MLSNLVLEITFKRLRFKNQIFEISFFLNFCHSFYGTYFIDSEEKSEHSKCRPETSYFLTDYFPLLHVYFTWHMGNIFRTN